jgi:hypothetical protein
LRKDGTKSASQSYPVPESSHMTRRISLLASAAGRFRGHGSLPRGQIQSWKFTLPGKELKRLDAMRVTRQASLIRAPKGLQYLIANDDHLAGLDRTHDQPARAQLR